MKLSPVLLALASTICAGCSEVVSIDPFIAEQEAIADNALPGTWQNAKGDNLYVIRQDGNGYTIQYSDKDSPGLSRFSALVVRVGDAELLDLVSTDDNPFQLAVHHLVRIWHEGSTLRWVFLDSDWMKQQASQLATRRQDKRIVIAASSEAVHALMLKAGADDRAFSGGETLTRVP